MTYRDRLTQVMTELSYRRQVVFVGDNLAYGSFMYGTMKGVDKSSVIEMPVAENLMTGIAIGMGLAEYNPVLVFERHDFIWLAMDQLVNHLDKLRLMSEGQFNPVVTIRAIVGNASPLDPGPQHTGDYTKVFEEVFRFPVVRVRTKQDIDSSLEYSDVPRMFVEYRSLYDTQV